MQAYSRHPQSVDSGKYRLEARGFDDWSYGLGRLWTPLRSVGSSGRCESGTGCGIQNIAPQCAPSDRQVARCVLSPRRNLLSFALALPPEGTVKYRNVPPGCTSVTVLTPKFSDPETHV